jgi:hypothetical protein
MRPSQPPATSNSVGLRCCAALNYWEDKDIATGMRFSLSRPLSNCDASFLARNKIVENIFAKNWQNNGVFY